MSGVIGVRGVRYCARDGTTVPMHTSNPEAPIAERLARDGYAFVPPDEVFAVLRIDADAMNPLRHTWSRLARDAYLRDGGRYRWRRHSCFVQEFSPPALAAVPHRAHWQPTSYNALHGGMERWFEPIEASVVGSVGWNRLLTAIGGVFAQVRGVERWFIEAHQFRIDTEGGIGRPTPEGAHRDGVDYVAVILVERRSVRGGETRVFEAGSSAGVRFTMTEPWSMLVMDDARVVHETTPIQPDGLPGHRDTLVLTYRAGGFQAPERTR